MRKLIPAEKKYTKQDMINAFWWGFNFHDNIVLRNIKNNILAIGDRKLKGKKLSDVAIENMFKKEL